MKGGNHISTIAELLVKIGADNSGLKKSLTESQDSIQSAFSANPINEFTNALSGATSGISGMVGKISSLAALTAGGFGLGSIVQGAVDAGESVYQLSTRMGIGAGEAAELSRILKLTGGDTQTFATAMLRLDKSYSSSGAAGDKCRAVLDATGVSLKDSSGKLLPLNQQLEQLSKGYNLAAASGQQEEFLMNTLGARGMALVGTLKEYAAAKEAATRVQGVGLDPAQMHELNIQMKTLGLEASQVGLAFTSALAPVAQEIFPPIMSGLKSTAAFLSENKTSVVELTKDALELAVAYKAIQVLGSAGNTIGTFFAKAAADAAASMATQTLAADELSVAQERAISRAVAASNAGYTKMQTAAVKAAQAMGLSAEEAAAIITEKSVQIATESATAAEAIRTQMTAAFLQSGTAATEFATVANTAIASTGAAATEAAVVKNAATSESAELCAAVVAESSATQVSAIETVSAASALAAEKNVAANAASAESASAVVLANERVALSHVAAGDAAILAGERTVGAMAIGSSAVGGMLSSVWALIGGWYGVAAAIGYSIYKLQQWYDEKNKGAPVTGYDEWGRPIYGEKTAGMGDLRDNERPSDSEIAAARSEMNKPNIPNIDLTGIAGMGGDKKGHKGKSDAEKELEKLQKKADQVNKEIDSSYQEMMDNKIQRVDDWYAKEKAKLDASASANSRYTEVLGELDTAYAEKKRKAYAEMLSNSTNIWIEAAKNQRELNDLMSTAGITGVEKQRLDLQNKYNDALAETEEKYKKLSVQFMGWDTETRTQYLLANKDVTKKDDGSLDFSKRINTENVAHKKDFEQQMKDLHYDSTKYQEALDQAYTDYSLTELQTLLNSESAIQSQYRIGQTAAMKEYYATWQETHRSTVEVMADALGQFRSGMTNVFKDIIKGVDGAKSVWVGFRDTVIDAIADIYARELSANLTSSLMSILPGVGKSSSSITVADGSGNAVFAGGGAVFGAGTGTSDSIPAWLSNGEFVFTADTTKSIGLDNLNYMNKTGNIPGYATGGLVTGMPRFATGGLVTGTSLSDISSGYSGSYAADRSANTGNINIVVNNNSNATVTATDGGIMDGIRQIVIEIAPDAVLDKAAKSPVYSRNLKATMG